VAAQVSRQVAMLLGATPIVGSAALVAAQLSSSVQPQFWPGVLRHCQQPPSAMGASARARRPRRIGGSVRARPLVRRGTLFFTSPLLYLFCLFFSFFLMPFLRARLSLGTLTGGWGRIV
jgi:hypothetical protein